MTDTSTRSARPAVLVVDDDAALRELLSDLVTEAGFRPIPATDGEEVLALARHHHPILALLDVGLPRMDGYAALLRLRGDPLTRHIPVIMVTGHQEPSFPPLSRDLGAAHLTKPFSLQELTAAMCRVLSAAPA